MRNYRAHRQWSVEKQGYVILEVWEDDDGNTMGRWQFEADYLNGPMMDRISRLASNQNCAMIPVYALGGYTFGNSDKHMHEIVPTNAVTSSDDTPGQGKARP